MSHTRKLTRREKMLDRLIFWLESYSQKVADKQWRKHYSETR